MVCLSRIRLDDAARTAHLLQEDVRAYFKIISTVHKLQPLSHAPDVKRDVVVKGSNIEKDDISAAVLQQLTDVMVKSGWEMCPQPSQQAAGACLLAKMATTGLFPYWNSSAPRQPG